MAVIDLITLAMLLVGVILLIGLWVLDRRKRLPPPQTWPRLVGLGAFAYCFISLMASSLLLRTFAEIVEFAPINTFLALCFGLAGYVTSLAHVRHNPKK